jgi:hypothetical protein
MGGGSVSFTLDGGETLTVPDEDWSGVYEGLWGLSKEPGAVSTATLMMDARRLLPFHRRIDLTRPQSVVLRKAVALLHV